MKSSLKIIFLFIIQLFLQSFWYPTQTYAFDDLNKTGSLINQPASEIAKRFIQKDIVTKDVFFSNLYSQGEIRTPLWMAPKLDAKNNYSSKIINPQLSKKSIQDLLDTDIEQMTASQKYDLLVGQYHQDISLTHLLSQHAKKAKKLYRNTGTPYTRLALTSRFDPPQKTVLVNSIDYHGKSFLIPFTAEDIQELMTILWKNISGYSSFVSNQIDERENHWGETGVIPVINDKYLTPELFHLILVNQVGIQHQPLIISINRKLSIIKSFKIHSKDNPLNDTTDYQTTLELYHDSSQAHGNLSKKTIHYRIQKDTKKQTLLSSQWLNTKKNKIFFITLTPQTVKPFAAWEDFKNEALLNSLTTTIDIETIKKSLQIESPLSFGTQDTTETILSPQPLGAILYPLWNASQQTPSQDTFSALQFTFELQQKSTDQELKQCQSKARTDSLDEFLLVIEEGGGAGHVGGRTRPQQ